jgi:copper chaperone
MSRTIAVDGMACGACEENVEEAVSELAGVTDAVADRETGVVTVEGAVDVDDLVAAVEAAGYEASIPA